MKRNGILSLCLALALLLTLLPAAALAGPGAVRGETGGDYAVDGDTALLYVGSELEPEPLRLPIRVKNDRAYVETADAAQLAAFRGADDLVLDFTELWSLTSVFVSAEAGREFYNLEEGEGLFTVWFRENDGGFDQYCGFTQPVSGLLEGVRVTVRSLQSAAEQALRLNDAQRAALAAFPADSAGHWKAYDVAAAVGEEPVSGESLAFAVSPETDWDRDQIRTYILDESGRLTVVPNRLGLFRPAMDEKILVAQMELEGDAVCLVSDVPLEARETPGPEDDGCPLRAFEDLDPEAWYHDGVHWALETGLMEGMGGRRFAPDAEVNRAMAVTLLWRYVGMPEAEGECPFADVPADAWYAKAVAWAAESGCVLGVSETEFAPDAPITREQMAALLYRLARSKGLGFVGTWTFLLPCADRDEVSGWAYEALCWLTMHGVVRNLEGDLLAPRAAATRAGTADAFWRFDALLTEKE